MCYIYTKEYYSATEGNEFESVELRWMNLEPVIQSSVQFSCSVVSNSFATPWTAARQASLSITNSQSLLRLMSVESVMPYNHLILCCPLLPSVFPGIRVSSSESALCIRWPKDWSFSFSVSPYSEYSRLISFSLDWFDLLAVQGQEPSPASQFESISSSVPFPFQVDSKAVWGRWNSDAIIF